MYVYINSESYQCVLSGGEVFLLDKFMKTFYFMALKIQSKFIIFFLNVAMTILTSIGEQANRFFFTFFLCLLLNVDVNWL